MSRNSRDTILNKLKAARTPFEDVEPIEEKRHMVSLSDATPDELYARFVTEATALACEIHEANSSSDAIEIVLDLLGDDTKTLMWDAEHIPLPGLGDALQQKGIQAADMRDESVRVGITGVDAALAATGSLVVVSGRGKARQASLLPISHIAVVRRVQILPDIETFYAHQRERGLDQFRESSNVAVISGPSKSADIAMELIHGMHGPGSVHIVIVP